MVNEAMFGNHKDRLFLAIKASENDDQSSDNDDYFSQESIENIIIEPRNKKVQYGIILPNNFSDGSSDS